MDQEINKETDLKEKIIFLFKNNKKKIYLLLSFFSILIIAVLFINNLKEKKDRLVSERYIEASIKLSQEKIEDAKILFEEVVNSKNKFYSILALNVIIEKNLLSDKKEILNYFRILEEMNLSKEQKDLVLFKKALYLNKITKNQEGNKYFKYLIDSDSAFKDLSKEIIEK